MANLSNFLFIILLIGAASVVEMQSVEPEDTIYRCLYNYLNRGEDITTKPNVDYENTNAEDHGFVNVGLHIMAEHLPEQWKVIRKLPENVGKKSEEIVMKYATVWAKYVEIEHPHGGGVETGHEYCYRSGECDGYAKQFDETHRETMVDPLAGSQSRKRDEF